MLCRRAARLARFGRRMWRRRAAPHFNRLLVRGVSHGFGQGNVGGFLPLMCQLVGSQGAVVALDLAPENVAHVEALVRGGSLPTNVAARVGSLLSLPFQEATFDCVWSANVMQYLSYAEFGHLVCRSNSKSRR